MGMMRMAKKDLLSFLEENIDELDFDGKIDLFWNKREKTFEMEVTFYAENKIGQMIEDAQGIASSEPIISFSDSILFYDEKNPAAVDEDAYFACLSYAGKKGWSLARGKAFFSYLQIVLDNGYSDLLDFLNDSDKEVFELTWSNEEFEKIVADATNNTSKQELRYPRF